MDIAYVTKIQEWVALDNQVKDIKEQIKALENKELVEKRDAIEKEIVEYIEKNKLEKLTINISDGNIKFSKTNMKSPLNNKTLKTLLDKYQEEEDNNIDVDALYNYIIDNIETKTKVSIRRN